MTTRPSNPRIVAVLGLLLAFCAGAACRPPASTPPASEDAALDAVAPVEIPRADAAPADGPLLFHVDLSDETVDALSLEELWAIGVEHLGWPSAPPAGAAKLDVHQRLLQEKYRNVLHTPIGY